MQKQWNPVVSTYSIDDDLLLHLKCYFGDVNEEAIPLALLLPASETIIENWKARNATEKPCLFSPLNCNALKQDQSIIYQKICERKILDT